LRGLLLLVCQGPGGHQRLDQYILTEGILGADMQLVAVVDADLKSIDALENDNCFDYFDCSGCPGCSGCGDCCFEIVLVIVWMLLFFGPIVVHIEIVG
jgi:hypothetical protein